MKRKHWWAVGITAIFLLVGVKKTVELAAPPAGEKRCDFVYPSSSDQTKPTTIELADNQVPPTFRQTGGTVNDASCLNKTSVFGVARIASEEDLVTTLAFAREHDLKITPSGAQHSMGGQSFVKDGIVLDMTGLNQVIVNKETMTMRVQSGATWAKVQQELDGHALSVKAMQSINIFSIGGTLSVNAHGIAHNPGQVASTVRSLRVMLADGSIVIASTTENSELFYHVLGGYGLFGVILEAEFDVVDNEVYTWTTQYIDHKSFPEFYASNVRGNDQLGLFFARLSVSPNGYLKETAVHTFKKTEWTDAIPAIKTTKHSALGRFIINLSKTGDTGRWIRWTLEKHFAGAVSPCITRNQAMSANEVCIISRNQQMYDSMRYLQNRLSDTDILQEYFVAPEQMSAFVDGLREIVTKNRANLLNITIRIVHKDTITALPYAKDDRFAFVLYFNQSLNETDSQTLRKTTTDLIDLATSLGGTFYLPYQLFYSPEQLRAAYPEVDAFFAMKRVFDPEERFTNTWYETYGK